MTSFVSDQCLHVVLYAEKKFVTVFSQYFFPSDFLISSLKFEGCFHEFLLLTISQKIPNGLRTALFADQSIVVMLILLKEIGTNFDLWEETPSLHKYSCNDACASLFPAVVPH